jgi:hypothetical protein
VKKDKIAYKSTTTQAREKDMRRFGIISIFKNYGIYVKNNLILLNKISQNFLTTTKLFIA